VSIKGIGSARRACGEGWVIPFRVVSLGWFIRRQNLPWSLQRFAEEALVTLIEITGGGEVKLCYMGPVV